MDTVDMLGASADQHPRPQLTRTHWTSLDGAWRFAYDDDAHGLAGAWQTRDDVYPLTISVPFPPESPASGIGQTGYHPIVWYRRTFTVTPPPAGQRLILHLGAVDYRAHVWVNGQLVATHEGGHTPFSADITTALREHGEQVIVIRAQDDPTDRTQPRGKQDWQESPHGMWYHRTTGIWQPVWLEQVGETHIAGLRWTPDRARRVLGLDVDVAGYDDVTGPLYLRVQLRLHGALLSDTVCPMSEPNIRLELPVIHCSRPEDGEQVLWSPEHPNLIDATLTLLDGDTAVDTAYSYAGMRDVACANNHFLLNGAPYYLRLVLEQGYWPQSHLAAPSAEALRDEVAWAKELGFNGVRMHQKVEDPRYLYWCDRLGLVVWGEMPSAYTFSPVAMQRLTAEWTAVLERDYSHPCIVTWVPMNESWGVAELERDARQRQFIQSLYHLTKAFDPTRPVIDNDGWQHVASDICSVHDYSSNGDRLRARYGTRDAVEQTVHGRAPADYAILLPDHTYGDQPVMVTEFGGISYDPAPCQEWYGYGTVSDADMFLAKYHELLAALLSSSGISGFCYTQLTDTRQEPNGLLTEDRRPKFDPAVIRSITTGVLPDATRAVAIAVA